MPSGKIGKVNFKEPLSAKILQIIEVGTDNYVFLKKNTGLVVYNSVSGVVENIQDDNFGEINSIIVNKDELLLLKPGGVYSIKIKNLLSKNYKINQIAKLKDGAFIQQTIFKFAHSTNHF